VLPISSCSKLMGRASHQRTQPHLVLLHNPEVKRALRAAAAKGSVPLSNNRHPNSHSQPTNPPTSARPLTTVVAGEPSAMGYDQGLPPHGDSWPQRSDYDPYSYAYALHSAAAASYYHQPPPPGTELAAPAAASSSWSSAAGASNNVVVGGPGANPLAVLALSQPTSFATSIGWSGRDVGHLPYYDPQYPPAQHPTAVFTHLAYVSLFTALCTNSISRVKTHRCLPGKKNSTSELAEISIGVMVL
jgi:hypothetical protein